MAQAKRIHVAVWLWTGSLCLCLLAGAAVAAEREEAIRSLKQKIEALSARIADLDAQLATSPGLKGDLDRRLELVAALAERARQRIYLEADRHPDRSFRQLLDLPAFLADRDRALAMLGQLLADAPGHPRRPEMLFARARLQREAGRYADMLDDLTRIVERHAGCPEAGQALLLMGDYYFDRNELAVAAKVYTKILARSEAPLKAQARYKLAWIAVNQEDCPRALALFGQVAREQNLEPGGPGAVDLRREALVDMTFCYARVGRPLAALDYFSHFQMSRAESVRVLGRLARQFQMREQDEAALALYRQLVRLAEEKEDKREFAERVRELEQALAAKRRPNQ